MEPWTYAADPTYGIKMAEQNGSQLLASYLEFKGHKSQVPVCSHMADTQKGGQLSQKQSTAWARNLFLLFLSEYWLQMKAYIFFTSPKSKVWVPLVFYTKVLRKEKNRWTERPQWLLALTKPGPC